MNAGVAISSLESDSASLTASCPMLLVAGVVRPDLVMDRLVLTKLSHQAEVSLIATYPALATSRVVDDLDGSQCQVIQPYRLAGGALRHQLLIHGILRQTKNQLSVKQGDRIDFQIIDDWQTTLDLPLDSLWWQDSVGNLRQEIAASNKPTFLANNRSTQTHVVGGQAIYVLQDQGQPWTVSMALSMLIALANLDVQLLLPQVIAEALLLERINLSNNLGRMFDTIFSAYDLFLQRHMTKTQTGVIESRTICFARKGRRISLPASDTGDNLSSVLSLKIDAPTSSVKKWVGRGDGATVESTFDLVHGWDASLEGGTDSLYGKGTNASFETYRNVYRRWVLNEEGAFTAGPFNQGNPYDLNVLFGTTGIRPQSLRFLDCLTLDNAGQRLSPIIQMSTDNGMSWIPYPGLAKISSRQATLYLNDTTLPASFLAAAKSNQAKIRVTSSLANPLPIEAVRWQGNPFFGQWVEQVIDVSGAFGIQRVAKQSIHASGIANGSLIALEKDDTLKLQVWLIQQIRQHSLLAEKIGRHGLLTLSDVWPMLRVGDQIVNLSIHPATAGYFDPSEDTLPALVRQVDCRWTGQAGFQTQIKITL